MLCGKNPVGTSSHDYVYNTVSNITHFAWTKRIQTSYYTHIKSHEKTACVWLTFAWPVIPQNTYVCAMIYITMLQISPFVWSKERIQMSFYTHTKNHEKKACVLLTFAWPVIPQNTYLPRDDIHNKITNITCSAVKAKKIK